MHIGLVGEDPNDTDSIKALLSQLKVSKINFDHLVRNQRGHQLDNVGFSRKLEAELQSKKINFIIYIRDLDNIHNDKDIAKKNSWFTNLNNLGGGNGIFILNIFEIEALILADIDNFNKIYKTKINYPGSPSHKKEPKEFLMEKTKHCQKKYRESDCPELFAKLNVETIEKRCDYFAEFLVEFREKVSPKKGKKGTKKL